MRRQKIFLLWILIICAVQQSNGQDTHKQSKGNIIIQVFACGFLDGSNSEYTQTGFDIGRAHLGYQYQFNKHFSAKVILDRGPSTTVSSISITDSAGKHLPINRSDREGSDFAMTLKFASLEWKISKSLSLQMGGILQNHYITQERFWGYRYVAQTFQDRYFHTPSGDLGIIGYYQLSRFISMDLALTNGEGFRSHQDIDGNVKLAWGIGRTPKTGLSLRFYTDCWPEGRSFSSTAQRLYSFFMGYRWENNARIGGEWNTHLNHNHVSEQTLEGFSLFGSFPINERSALFLRADRLASDGSEESTNWNAGGDGLYFICGVHYNPVAGVSLSVNYQGWKPRLEIMDYTNQFYLSFEFKK